MTELDQRLRIRDKARDLFMQYGIRTVSMDDIANAMGMSKKTLYQWYADKEDLVFEVMKGQIEWSESACDSFRSVSTNAIEELFRTMEMVEEMFANMNPSVLIDMQKYHPKAFELFTRHKHTYIYNVIRENLEWGIKEELYRTDIDVEIITNYRLACMLLPFDPSFMGKQKFSIAAIEQQITEHYLFGIATLKGHKLILKYKEKRHKSSLHGKTK